MLSIHGNGFWRFHYWVSLGVAIVASSALAAETKLPKNALLRIGDNRFTHGGSVREIATVPELGQIVTWGGDESARIWDKSGEPLRTIPLEETLTNISVSMDGRWRLGTVRSDAPPGETRWLHVATNLVTGKEIRLGPVRFPAYSLGVAADGALLAVGNPGAELSLVDVKSGETLAKKVLPGENNVAGYPRVFLAPDASLLLAEQPRGDWHVFDLKDRHLDDSLPPIDNMPHAKPVLSSRKGIAAIVGWNGRIVIRDLYEGETLVEFQHGSVTALGGAFSPDDKILATCGADGFIRLWNVADGKLIHAIDTEERHIFAVAFTPDGATLLSGGRRIRFWSVATGREQSIAGPGLGVIESVAVSPNAQTAALADNLGNVSLWSLPSGKLLGVLPDQDIAGGPYDPWVGHPFLAFNAPGDILVAGSSNRHNSVNVWNVSNRQRKARCIGHDWPITAVACSRDGNVIISGSRDKTVRAWTTAGRSLWKSVGNGPQVLTVAFAPDDKRIYTGGHSNIIDVLSRESGAVIDQVPIPADGRESLNAVSVVAPSSSGRYLAAVTGESTSGRRVVVLDLERKQEAFRLGGKATSLHTPPDEIYLGVAFHPYRDVLAVVKGDGAVQLYQAPSGNLVASFHGHTAAANAVAWSGDGNRLLSGSSDGTAILWDTAFLEPR